MTLKAFEAADQLLKHATTRVHVTWTEKLTQKYKFRQMAIHRQIWTDLV